MSKNNNNSKPCFSIIIPTYNNADFLRESVNDVIRQTIANWECIVIDNQSNDDTRSVIDSFQDRRLKLITVNNMGIIAKSRNIGIKIAEGNWLAFLDADDRWYPNRLEIIQKYITLGGDVMVYSTDEKIVNIVKNSESVNYYGPFDFHFYENLLIFGNRLSTSATIVNRAFIINNMLAFSENINHVTVEDYDFWMKIAKSGAVFKFIPLVCGEYIIHGNNATSKVELHYYNLRTMLYEHIDSFGVTSKTFHKIFIKSIVDVRIDLTYNFSTFLFERKLKNLLKIFFIFVVRPLPALVYVITLGILKQRARYKH